MFELWKWYGVTLQNSGPSKDITKFRGPLRRIIFIHFGTLTFPLSWWWTAVFLTAVTVEPPSRLCHVFRFGLRNGICFSGQRLNNNDSHDSHPGHPPRKENKPPHMSPPPFIVVNPHLPDHPGQGLSILTWHPGISRTPPHPLPRQLSRGSPHPNSVSTMPGKSPDELERQINIDTVNVRLCKMECHYM